MADASGRAALAWAADCCPVAVRSSARAASISLGGGAAAGGERDEQFPAEVGVHVEAAEGDSLFEEGKHGVEVVRGAGDLGEALDELELCVAALFGVDGELPEGVADALHGRALTLGGDVGAGGEEELAEDGAQRGGFGFCADVGEDEIDEIAGGRFGVAGGVPDAAPDEGARQRGERGEVIFGGGEGTLVEADFRVAQVVVVEQDEVGAGLADEFGDLGAGAFDVELDAVDAGERPVDEGVEADGEAVRAQRRVVGVGALRDAERGEGAVFVGVDFGFDEVDPGFLEPHLRPGGEVPAAGGLKFAEEVRQFCVRPRMLVEIAPETGEELLPTDPCDELFEHGGALGVGDAVEVDLDIGEVFDARDDRVCARQLVLAVGPRFLDRGEGRPRVASTRWPQRWPVWT